LKTCENNFPISFKFQSLVYEIETWEKYDFRENAGFENVFFTHFFGLQLYSIWRSIRFQINQKSIERLVLFQKSQFFSVEASGAF
jgi:hypothetical protein